MANETGELVITRIFDAPRELVWKMWTEPEYFKKWWGPKVFTCPVSKIDFRVGGEYLHCMRGAAGPGVEVKDYWSTGTYKEIVPMEKIVVTDSFADENGNVVPATHYGMEGFPTELLVTITFEEYPPAGGGKTKMTLVHSGLEKVDAEMLKNMDQGWNESFDKLAQSIKQSG